jgi:uncharacterized GH25 family protein
MPPVILTVTEEDVMTAGTSFWGVGRQSSPRRSGHARSVAGVLALVLAAAPTAAHDTWLLPARSRVEPGQTLALAMTSGMAFPHDESPIGAERVAKSGVRLAGSQGELAAGHEGEQALQLRAELSPAGIATLWLELRPRTLELTAEDVAHYLEEIGSPAPVRARWQAMPEPRRWRESYRKNVKTFVRVGEAAADRSWAEPVGSPLELVPESDPTALRAGDHLSLRLLRDGQPAPGITVGLLRGGETAATNRESDRDGRVGFELERDGWYLLRVTDLRPATGKDLDWESDFATLTLEVQGAAVPQADGSR